ncbi:MAG: SufS family cysteine desulfurase, partial [Chloroflexota bacterium]|nr:SufS family cysteine desulfurase [Chloroflexota bacterium]
VNGRPLVYLDNAASSHKPRQVVDALVHFYTEINANVHRGVHTLSVEATDAYEQARERVARFVGSDDPRELVFVRNTTEALNLVAVCYGRATLQPGDEILATLLEHHSNLVPWQRVAQETGASIRLVPLTGDGAIDITAFRAMLSSRTRVVAVASASNVLGTINPIADIADMAHGVGAVVVVDGAQSVPHVPTDVGSMGADFLAFSGHKMLGPTGIGALWARREHLEAMPPFLGGGGMIREVFEDRATWAPLPEKFEAGTPAVADAIGLAAAVDYLDGLGMHNVRAHEVEVTAYALERLARVPKVTVYGPPHARDRTGVVSFNLDGVHPHDAGTVLDELGVAVRAGHHCCQPLHRALDTAATLRASFYVYNDLSDVDALVEALGAARRMYQRRSA